MAMRSSLRRLDEVQESKYREQDKNEKRRFLPARCGTEIESVRFRLRNIRNLYNEEFDPGSG